MQKKCNVKKQYSWLIEEKNIGLIINCTLINYIFFQNKAREHEDDFTAIYSLWCPVYFYLFFFCQKEDFFCFEFLIWHGCERKSPELLDLYRSSLPLTIVNIFLSVSLSVSLSIISFLLVYTLLSLHVFPLLQLSQFLL